MPVYNITFTETPGSYGTLIEYMKVGTNIWITPNSPANPTNDEIYPLTLDAGSTYYIRVTSVGNNKCTPKPVIISIITSPLENCCPDTYTLSPDETYCYKTETVPATPPTGGDPDTTIPKSLNSYTWYGTLVYEPGFAVNGIGTNIRKTPYVAGPWANPPSPGSPSIGPLNRTGLWGHTSIVGQEVGFSYCFSLAESKQYYIAVAADNTVIIRIDGNTILDMDDPAMTASLYAQYGIVETSSAAPYTFWHCYPVTIESGPHILEMIGKNGPGTGTNPAAMGAEIYDNTKAELLSAASVANLNVIFSTETLRNGSPLQIGSDGLGYTCPDGYALDSCVEPYTCKRLLTTPTITCA